MIVQTPAVGKFALKLLPVVAYAWLALTMPMFVLLVEPASLATTLMVPDGVWVEVADASLMLTLKTAFTVAVAGLVTVSVVARAIGALTERVEFAEVKAG